MSYHDHIQSIAASYAALISDDPPHDALTRRAWRELSADAVARSLELRMWYDIRETDDPEPYPDAPAMFHDLNRGRFTVSRAFCEHPIWTPAENVAFRIVHDIDGHRVTRGGFDWEGENAACAAHATRELSPLALSALFCECIAQTGYAIACGGFGPQRCALIPAPAGGWGPSFENASQLLDTPRFDARVCV